MKNDSGVTLVTLGIFIIIMLIIIGSITFSLSNVVKVQNLNKVYGDIKSLDDRIAVYYINNAELPVLEKYGSVTHMQSILNPNDNENYYKIDISKLDNLTLNNPNDDYIINEESHVIYYPNGVTTNTGTYYKLPGNYTEVSLKTIVNKPILNCFNSENAYFVTWSEQSGEYVENSSIKINNVSPKEWYNYSVSDKKWANIKTIANGNVAYWVWIPRYAYMIDETNYNKNTTGNVKIKFLQGKTNIPYGEKEEINNSTQGAGKWLVHPAFSLGNKQLEGIWVAKFEASSSNNSLDYGGGNNTNLQVNVLPNVTSWRGITIDNAYKVCRNIETTGGTIGLNLSLENIDNSTGLDTTPNIDTHLMKNEEWGAVAYLSKSSYGKSDKVWINPYGNEFNSPKTGISGQSVDSASTVDNGQINEYNKGNGINASTTGNVYGIYDMNGGALEFVLAYIQNTQITNNINTQVLLSINNIYKNKYNIGQEDTQTYNYNRLPVDGKYGDAVYETSSNIDGNYAWDNGETIFPNTDFPILARGGMFNKNMLTSIFSFRCVSGDADENITFRPVITVYIK